jgi:hypothetical protein
LKQGIDASKANGAKLTKITDFFSSGAVRPVRKSFHSLRLSDLGTVLARARASRTEAQPETAPDLLLQRY